MPVVLAYALTTASGLFGQDFAPSKVRVIDVLSAKGTSPATFAAPRPASLRACLHAAARWGRRKNFAISAQSLGAFRKLRDKPFV